MIEIGEKHPRAIVSLMGLLFLFVGGDLWAEYGTYGIGAEVSFLHERREGIASTSRDTEITLKPIGSIMLEDDLEVAPFALFGFSLERTGGTKTYQDFSIGVGSDLIWHLLITDHFRFGTGATLSLGFSWIGYDAVYNHDWEFDLGVHLPIVAEFVINDSFSFRGKLNVMGAGWTVKKSETGTGEQKDNLFYLDTVNGLSDVLIGLYYRF